MKSKILFLIICLTVVSFASGGTIVHYNFQEKASGYSAEVGDVIDNEAAGLNATVAGGALDYVNGPEGMTALNFEADGGGEKDRIDIPASSDFVFTAGADGFTIEAIINIGTNADTMGIVAQDNGSASITEWWWRVQSGQIRWYIKGDNKSSNFVSAAKINDGNWHHVAATYDPVQEMIFQYIDGEVAGQADASNVTGFIGSDLSEIAIGEFRTSTGRDLKGQIATVRISDVALTPEDFIDMTPTGASNYAPADGIVDVDTDAPLALSWDAGQDPNNPGMVNPNIISHLVYAGTDPQALELKATVASTNYGLTGLDKDTEYFWRIDENLASGGVIFGQIYSFETELTLPQIDVQPTDAKAWPGEDATFTVAATDPLGGTLSYQWFCDPNVNDAVPAEALTDDEKYQGATAATLTVLDVDEADLDKVFFCTIGNPATIDTDTVSLSFKSIFAHWRLNETEGAIASDSSGNGYDGTLNGNQLWVPAQIENGLRLSGSGDGVLLVEHAPDFTTLSTGTISLWANVHAASGAACLLTISDDTQGSRELRFFFESGDLRFGTRGALTNATVSAGSGYMDDQWHLFTVTHSADGMTSMYVDGLLVVTETSPWFDGFADGSINHMAIGCNKDTGGLQWFLNGIVDDIRVYDYPLSATEVADLYVSVEDPICVRQPQCDFNGDCVVNLIDFKDFAAQWMQCNWVPASVCP
ncbi:MAG: hypothetical protein JEZ07_14485 [Phycisphaerae bacterium]|nr:hypothetical protein [Phycisphaerae bacterium]